MTDNEFLFAWEIKYKCPKCMARMKYKPERMKKEKGDFGVLVVNHWHCSKCEFKTKGVSELVKE